MRIEPEIGGANVVVVGEFNPAIFTPAWFALHGLLPGSAADDAEAVFVASEFAAFSFDWLVLEVMAERFEVRTAQEPLVRVCDLVAKIFHERLDDAPVTALGINREVHFRVENREARDRIGRALAPVEPWGALGSNLGLDRPHGGLASLTMSGIHPGGRPAEDRINVTVEPSHRIGDGRLGVFVKVNDHYALGEAAAGAGAHPTALLEKNFDESLKRSDGIVDHIMSLSQRRTG